MNETINLLINAIKTEAQTQVQELEEIKQTIFALLENFTATEEDKEETRLYGVSFKLYGSWNAIHGIRFERVLIKRTYKPERLIRYTPGKYTLEDLQTFANTEAEENTKTNHAGVETAVEKLYKFDLVPYFMQYLSAKILPQFLRNDYNFTDFHF